MRRIAVFLILLIVVVACTSGSGEEAVEEENLNDSGTAESAAAEGEIPPEAFPAVETNRRPAPQFAEGLDWLNTDRPLVLSQLTGKIVLLDFWTYGCINCIHVIPDLKRIEAEYPDEVVVIGVHSAKFRQEQGTDNIRQIILRYGIEHPVVNDHGFQIWGAYGVNAWPTMYAIDPGGGVVGFHSGEGVYDVVQPVIEQLLVEFEGSIDRTPLALKLESEGLPETVLSFPGKVTAASTDAGDRLYISDTNHNRIVQTTLDGDVLDVFGTGEAGYVDGDAGVASLNQPQGSALSANGKILYVADTENHVVRGIDVASGAIETIAGTGTAGFFSQGGPALEIDINSPWDLELEDDQLYIAMAGFHQLWVLDLTTGIVSPYAGNRAEGVVNGPAADAELAQPSAVSLADDGRLFFADSESSAIRWVDTTTEERLVGIAAGSDENLFDFGDEDGVGTESLLQHPLGVVAVGETVFLTDTYNSKVKAIDLQTGAVDTRWGESRGWRDGEQPLFYEPGGIDHLDGMLYIADTNNHSIRVIDLDAGTTNTLVLKGIQAFMPLPGDDQYEGVIVVYDEVSVGAGPGEFVLNIVLPAGYKVNPEAPSSFLWSVDGDSIVVAPDASGVRVDPSFPLTFGATYLEGNADLTGDLSVVYCDAEAESICLIEQLRVVVPIRVENSGGSSVSFSYEIVLPEI